NLGRRRIFRQSFARQTIWDCASGIWRFSPCNGGVGITPTAPRATNLWPAQSSFLTKNSQSLCFLLHCHTVRIAFVAVQRCSVRPEINQSDWLEWLSWSDLRYRSVMSLKQAESSNRITLSGGISSTPCQQFR